MSNQQIPILRNSFTNINGECFENVREVAYKKDQLYGNVGQLVAETKHEPNLIYGFDSNPGNGVYIYQSKHDANIAYRIYKTFADYGFNGYFDDKLIQQLFERSSNVKLTKFPTGVVTLDGRIIGQVVPYYQDYVTLLEYLKKYFTTNPTILYRAILDSLRELNDNGIAYLDIHPKNFMVRDTLNCEKTEIIDFEWLYIRFDDDSSSLRYEILKSFSYMINSLNKMIGLSPKICEFKVTDDFDDALSEIEKMEKILKK